MAKGRKERKTWGFGGGRGSGVNSVLILILIQR